MADSEVPVPPDYRGACVTSVVAALLGAVDPPAWMPDEAFADQTVLLVLDGLGWDQLQGRTHVAPTLSSLVGGPITTVAPSTTASALTSITTGLTPGQHGIVGYRLWVDSEVLNVLRWTTPKGDARKVYRPDVLQPHETFDGQRPAVVTKAEFIESGFTSAHLAGGRFHGYRMTSSLVTEVVGLVRRGEPFVYAYYDGVDKVAHEYGFGPYYDAELRAADRLVADLLDYLPRGVSLVVTADHGQVQTGDAVVKLHGEVQSHVGAQSGEGRFRWLHARPGRAGALAEACRSFHGDQAWVRTRQEILAEGWLGPEVSEASFSRLGDVALVAKGVVSFVDPQDGGPFKLIGRHGSLTSAEMLVPLLAGRSPGA